MNVLLLRNTQTQTGTASSLDKLESWSSTTLSSTTSTGDSPRPVLFRVRLTRKKMQLQKLHVATPGADQAPSHHKRRQLLPSCTETNCYHLSPWGVLCEWGGGEGRKNKIIKLCVANLAALKSLLREMQKILPELQNLDRNSQLQSSWRTNQAREKGCSNQHWDPTSVHCQPRNGPSCQSHVS